MAFEATKREWSELYAFFRLLADGKVYAGTPEVKINKELAWPVAMIQREEHDGTFSAFRTPAYATGRHCGCRQCQHRQFVGIPARALSECAPNCTG